MARITLLPPASFNRDNFFYNVDTAVGAGCPNKRDDVLLVQYFIVTINNNPNVFSPPIPTIPLKPNQIFRPDGVAGPITVRAIEHFQQVGQDRGNNITVDGRVDKASGSGFGTISNTQFTIIFLNNAYRNIRVGAFQNITILAGDCPGELRSALSLG
jgi:peptidoglycan hydrolase-like protein with peptidoglycan-binding domain